jgi:ATP-dependent exoDNAse (exonuclease V) beta subunit
VLLASEQPTGTLRDEAVRILPIHSSRGLQFRIVVLLWTDLLLSRFRGRDEATDRGLLYVAMTRAENMLVVLHSGSSPYVEELYRALDAAPAS